jgi:hypothetical protein
MSAREAYDAGRVLHGRAVDALDRRARALGAARLCVAGVACVLLGAIVWAPLDAAGHARLWVSLGVTVLAFVALVVLHARVHDAARLAAASLRFHRRGLDRLGHSWDELPTTSARFASPGHPYTTDLDVFGRASVMQLVDATETRLGEERLAHLLSFEGGGGWPDDTRARQEAARDLAGRFAFRERLATRAGIVPPEDRGDVTAMLRWAEGSDGGPGAIAWLAWLLPPVALAAMLVGPAVGLQPGWIVALVVAEMAAGHFATARIVPALAVVSDRLSAVAQWRSTIECIEQEPFEAPLLASLGKRLVEPSAEPRRASDALAGLERIVGFADARRNEMFRFFFGPVLMWDAHCALALMRWRRRAGGRLRGWLETLGEIDALASLGGFAFEHPDYAWPALAATATFEAQALGHPLIADDRRVGNDVRFASGGRALVITGSNMSGKSTFLRAIGVNAVLAAAGAPVCAKSLRIGPLQVATSMRIDDSLEQGVSHFYAELRRLKVDRAKQAPQARPPASVLFLLDEILHGTNSRERVIGAAAVVRELLAHGAIGGVSTHDVGITALGNEMGDRVQNAHFEEQVEGETMTFDYVLRPGIVQSSNALRLMRAVGIDVPLRDESRAPG